ncbi:MAG: ankyrin repeat domain-containing protein [Candidatus Aminicenantes bacterium]|nr:MAG: ankyrin repeat domain-containing protein [Candidatus Aminicenantes bacterium]
MKLKTIFVGFLMLILLTFSSYAQLNDFPVLKGPYLGQKPPGKTPEIFAPGIVSRSDYHEHSSPAFSPDGKEVYWSAYCSIDGVQNERIFFSRYGDMGWTNPIIVEFTKEFDGGHPTVSPDGNRIYFHSYRPKTYEERFGQYHIWYVEKMNDVWSVPIKLGEPINTETSSWNPMFTYAGYFFYSTDRDEGFGDGDIYRAKIVNNQFINLENLGENINTEHNEYSPCVNSDDGYIIFSRYTEKPKGVQLYISFQRSDGSWSLAEKLDKAVPLMKRARFPGLSHDKKYLFFNAYKERDVEIYWLDAGVIEEFKTDESIVEVAKNGDLKTVKAILDKNPSLLNIKNQNGYTALHWACMRAHWNIVRYLVEKGADLNVVGGDGGTQINWAVHHDNVEIIKLLLANGAKLNSQNQWGMTELHTAIWRGNINVVRFLLDHGSDPDIKTKEGWTAMHYAYRSGHDNIIEMLKKRGLSMTEKDNMGRTPQYLYFKKPNPIEMSISELDEYRGKYYVGDYLLLEIWREGDRLRIMEFGPDEIYPVAKDFFYFKQAPWTLIFSRDQDGKIHHAQLSFIRRSYTIKKK